MRSRFTAPQWLKDRTKAEAIPIIVTACGAKIRDQADWLSISLSSTAHYCSGRSAGLPSFLGV